MPTQQQEKWGEEGAAQTQATSGGLQGQSLSLQLFPTCVYGLSLNNPTPRVHSPGFSMAPSPLPQCQG